MALAAALFFLQIPAAGAQSTISFPEMPVDSRTARVQNLAEEVYTRGNFERAYFIYRNELTPIGDKYGQYMVGYMHLTGKGVERDIVAASAWYRLAAERGTVQFVKARDELLARLGDEQRAKSDELFIDIRQQYGDLVLLARAIREDYEILRDRTGSRVAAGSSPVAVLNLRGEGGATADSDYYGRIERRMRARIRYIAQHTNTDIVDLVSETGDIGAIEAEVAVHLSRLP